MPSALVSGQHGPSPSERHPRMPGRPQRSRLPSLRGQKGGKAVVLLLFGRGLFSKCWSTEDDKAGLRHRAGELLRIQAPRTRLGEACFAASQLCIHSTFLTLCRSHTHHRPNETRSKHMNPISQLRSTSLRVFSHKAPIMTSSLLPRRQT